MKCSFVMGGYHVRHWGTALCSILSELVIFRLSLVLFSKSYSTYKIKYIDHIREVEISNGYGYQGNHRNFLRITSAVSAFTSFLHVLITCGAASTCNYKCVVFKIKTSQMMNENILVDHCVGLLNSFARIKNMFVNKMKSN